MTDQSEGKTESKTEAKEVERVTESSALSPWEEMDRFFDRFMGRGLGGVRWSRPSWSDLMAPFQSEAPRIDIINRETEILVRAEIPGIDKEDLDVSMTDNTVTIKGMTRREEQKEEGDYFRREISSGSFSRTVTLPGDVDAGKAKASFQDGVLELTIPKAEGSKRHSIKVE
jgi:HSP20 family protein